MIKDKIIKGNEASFYSQANLNVENLFDAAINAANKGLKLKAINIAKEALIYAKQQGNYTAIYIHSFLAVLSIDFKQYTNARIHLYHALNLLKQEHFSYKKDLSYIQLLVQKLNQLDHVYQEPTRHNVAA